MFVYVVQASEFCHKIGISNDPKARLTSLRTGHYQDLKLIYEGETPNAAWAEGVIHQHFASKRIRGEWFAVSAPEARSVHGRRV